ncbi:hypothetical protein [Tunicatimonas pelagia]|uniref:hypothetical protein n=1 Tax=Tunicatimonas pelagia TaxID=931531 RepID=UPI00266650B8|nr:hypothetical protein [Tunicatimonas pelagia]WKN45146.1 hypothetical protein P0M28_09250 [Tunicatimonas pelagia]
MKTTIFDYDQEEYNFAEIITDYLEADDLSQLRASLNGEKFEANSLYKNMEQSSVYQRLYACLNSEEGKQFYNTYERFVQEVIRPQYDEPILYQKKPTHRILFLDTPGISRFHRDRDYGHNTAEINYFVPQTKAFDTNTVWIESEEGLQDFNPMELEIGQFARFNGASLEHGAVVNATGKSRVSFDFRIIPFSKTPAKITDTSSWNEADKENPLFQNAHSFSLCH